MLLYLLIGLIFAFMVRIDSNDRMAITSFGPAFVCIVLWPLVLVYAILNVKRIKIKGKVIWERKK